MGIRSIVRRIFRRKPKVEKVTITTTPAPTLAPVRSVDVGKIGGGGGAVTIRGGGGGSYGGSTQVVGDVPKEVAASVATRATGTTITPSQVTTPSRVSGGIGFQRRVTPTFEESKKAISMGNILITAPGEKGGTFSYETQAQTPFEAVTEGVLLSGLSRGISRRTAEIPIFGGTVTATEERIGKKTIEERRTSDVIRTQLEAGREITAMSSQFKSDPESFAGATGFTKVETEQGISYGLGSEYFETLPSVKRARSFFDVEGSLILKEGVKGTGITASPSQLVKGGSIGLINLGRGIGEFGPKMAVRFATGGKIDVVEGKVQELGVTDFGFVLTGEKLITGGRGGFFSKVSIAPYGREEIVGTIVGAAPLLLYGAKGFVSSVKGKGLSSTLGDVSRSLSVLQPKGVYGASFSTQRLKSLEKETQDIISFEKVKGATGSRFDIKTGREVAGARETTVFQADVVVGKGGKVFVEGITGGQVSRLVVNPFQTGTGVVPGTGTFFPGTTLLKPGTADIGKVLISQSIGITGGGAIIEPASFRGAGKNIFTAKGEYVQLDYSTFKTFKGKGWFRLETGQKIDVLFGGGKSPSIGDGLFKQSDIFSIDLTKARLRGKKALEITGGSDPSGYRFTRYTPTKTDIGLGKFDVTAVGKVSGTGKVFELAQEGVLVGGKGAYAILPPPKPSISKNIFGTGGVSGGTGGASITGGGGQVLKVDLGGGAEVGAFASTVSKSALPSITASVTPSLSITQTAFVPALLTTGPGAFQKMLEVSKTKGLVQIQSPSLKSFQEGRVSLISKGALDLVPRSGEKTKQLSLLEQFQIPRLAQSQRLRVPQLTEQIALTTGFASLGFGGITGAKGGFWLPPLFGALGQDLPKQKRRRVKKQPKRRQASLAAIALDIRSPKMAEFETTGLVLRPIIKGKRKRKK